MALDIRGKTALVTGGASGICLEVTRQLLAGGCNVLVADLKPSQQLDDLIQAVRDDGSRASFIRTDVTKWNELRAAFDQAVKDFGQLDIVVPGAGIFEPEGFSNFWCLEQGTDTTEASSFKTLEVNVAHPIRATQLAIDSFLRRKTGHGVVVLISSIAAQLSPFFKPVYAASKNAISGFVRSLGDLEPTLNIRVNGIAPGLVKTAIWTEDVMAYTTGEDLWVTPERVAGVILDLITDKDHVGGTILEVGKDKVRPVTILNDPGPSGAGTTVGGVDVARNRTYQLIEQNFGK